MRLGTKKMSDTDENRIEVGSGNVFADLGFPDPETHEIKAQLVGTMLDVMKRRELTQTKAALVMGVSQPELSKYSRGQFRHVSVERLMTMLTKLGCEVDIVVHHKEMTPFAPIHMQAAVA